MGCIFGKRGERLHMRLEPVINKFWNVLSGASAWGNYWSYVSWCFVDFSFRALPSFYWFVGSGSEACLIYIEPLVFQRCLSSRWLQCRPEYVGSYSPVLVFNEINLWYFETQARPCFSCGLKFLIPFEVIVNNDKGELLPTVFHGIVPQCKCVRWEAGNCNRQNDMQPLEIVPSFSILPKHVTM